MLFYTSLEAVYIYLVGNADLKQLQTVMIPFLDHSTEVFIFFTGWSSSHIIIPHKNTSAQTLHKAETFHKHNAQVVSTALATAGR